MSTVSTEKMMAQIACKAIDDKKGQDIKVIDIHNVSVIADYFVIASGTNSNQVQAIVDNVEEQLGRAGFEAKQIEGNRNSSWILMDYGDVIVHVFDEENRLFYDLERWKGSGNGCVFREIKKSPLVNKLSGNSNCLLKGKFFMTIGRNA